MKLKITEFFKQKWAFVKKHYKWAIAIIIVLLVAIPKLIPDGFNPKNEIVETVKTMDLKKTVSVTGTVTSVVDLNLAFNNTGRVASVNTILGARVYQGQVLASLSAGSEMGQLNQAYGQLKSAQAALARVIEGSTNEEVRIAEVTLASAKSSLINTQNLQYTLVHNARRVLYSSNLEAVSTFTTSSSLAPTISGTYSANTEDEYTISLYPTGAGGYASITSTSGDSGSFSVATNGPISFGSKGLYLTFISSSINNNETYKIKIPNLSSNTYSANLNSLNNALQNQTTAIESAQNVVDSAEANLALKRAAARPSDVSAKEADVLTAQGRVQQAQAAYEEKVIRAPMSGVITKLDVNVGENVDAKKTVIVLQDKGELFLEANINEGDIDEIQQGQMVTFTVDTLPANEVFTAEINHIDQSSTKEGSIVNYTVRAIIKDSSDKIKTGSTANLSILINQKPNVLVVPARTIKKDESGRTYVWSVTNEKRAKTIEKDVVVGLAGDGALIEIVSGLNDGEKILFKTK